MEIIWYHDFLSFPRNGLGVYNDDKVWFKYDEESEKFDLFSVTEETIKMLNENREKYCELTGVPFKYGDPQKMRSEITPKTVHIHPYNPYKIGDNLICTIEVDQVKNLSVPHRVF